MSNKLSSAFNALLKLSSFPMVWERPGTELDPGEKFPTIQVSNSFYGRNREGPEELTLTGREFVIAYEQVKDLDFFPIKKGDLLVDENPGGYGVNSIKEIEIMKGIRGEIIGYRVRTD